MLNQVDGQLSAPEQENSEDALSGWLISNSRKLMADPDTLRKLEIQSSGHITKDSVGAGVVTGGLVFLFAVPCLYLLTGEVEFLLSTLLSVAFGALLVAMAPYLAKQQLAEIERVKAQDADRRWREARLKAERELRETEITTFIRTHVKTLKQKYEEGHRSDDYGNIIDSGWQKELLYFWERVLSPRFPSMQVSEAEHHISAALCKPRISISGGKRAFDAVAATGTDFELHVKQRLELFGWHVQHKGKAGDQGADLVADKNGITAVIQCKYFSSPVGNSSVQEVFAAKSYYSADYAVVISNASFTQGARQLALGCDVALLDPENTYELDAFIAHRQTSSL